MKSFLRNGLALIVATLFSIGAFAHVWEIRVNQNQDGTLTWYLQSYHPVNQCGISNSGITINGVNYPLTVEVAGSAASYSPTVFATTAYNYQRGSVGIVTTPFIPGVLYAQAYSTNACWYLMANGSGTFVPPPPPTCTSCPVTGVSANFGAGNSNGTSCNTTDDFVPASMVVNHLACASITGDGKFSVIHNGNTYGPYDYSTGITTSIPLSLNVGYGESSTDQITVVDADYGNSGCSFTGGASYGSTFNGVAGAPDLTPPTISCGFDITVDADANACGAYVSFTAPSATDNCGTGALPTSIPGYTYKGTLNGHTYFLSNGTATPEAAHAAAISLGGHLATIANSTENTFVSNFTSGRIWIGMTDRDSEGTWGWITSEPYSYSNWAPGEPNNYGGNEDWAVINWSGNNPDWNDWYYTQPAYYSVEFDGGSIPTTQTAGLPSGSFFSVGTHTITYTATDDAGNSSSCSFTITVNDNSAPSVVTQDITVALDASGAASITANDVDGGSSDNCSIASLSISNNSFTCANLGANTVTLYATDANGNSSSNTATVTVVDNTAPVVATKDVSVTLANGTASITTADIENGSTDNCSIASMSLDNDTWTCGDIGTHTVTLTVTDASGNASTGTATVTVNGVIPTCSIASEPTSNVYTGGDPNKIYLGYGAQSTVLNLTPSGGNSFTYNWTGSNLSSTTAQDPTFSPTAAGVYTFTCVVTNDNGCETTCSITICVEDVRVYKKGKVKPGKVYLCHSPNGNPNNTQTLSISVNAVAAHLSNHSNDALGTCGQTACGSSKGYDIDAGDMYTDETAAGEMELVVYPNPSRSQFGLMLESPVEGMIQIRVYTLQGQIVEEYKSESNMVNMEFGNDLATGIYMLDVIQGDYRKTVRIEKL